MSIDNDKITEIICMAEDVCQIYDRSVEANGLVPVWYKDSLGRPLLGLIATRLSSLTKKVIYLQSLRS